MNYIGLINNSIDWAGQQYGLLTALGRVENDKWLFSCTCGNKIVAEIREVRRGAIKSCGCLKNLKGNLIGKRFGMLTVLEKVQNGNRGEVRFKCRCDCGSEKIIASRHLRNGSTQSCGCLTKNHENLLGKKFNMLTPIEYCGKGNWKCLCDCGNTTIAQGSVLKSNKRKSCGCEHYKSENVIGKKFNHLRAIEKVGRDNQNRVLYRCLCDCGNYTVVKVDNLRSGQTKSCGCLSHEHIDLTGERFGKLKVIEYIGGGNGYWKCRCDCGAEKIISGGALRQGDAKSCGCSIVSSGEYLLRKIFRENNIKYEEQKTFEGLVNKVKLRPDFYLPNQNIVIEYNGIQHYRPVKRFGGEKQFHAQQQRDLKVRDYCKSKGIKLVEISYRYNTESKIKNFLIQNNILT